MTKHTDAKPTTSFAGQKATLNTAPAATSGRWNDPRYKPAVGHAMKAGKFKGVGSNGYGK